MCSRLVSAPSQRCRCGDHVRLEFDRSAGSGRGIWLISARMAASSQISAICKKISRSLSDLAVFAQPKHSSAYSRYSFGVVMIRSAYLLVSLPTDHGAMEPARQAHFPITVASLPPREQMVYNDEAVPAVVGSRLITAPRSHATSAGRPRRRRYRAPGKASSIPRGVCISHEPRR